MNKKVVGTLGLAAVALVGGTFAYFTQTSTIDNPFNTAKYSTVVTEDFKPEDGDKWEPGAEVNKDLYVENTGDRDVVVRVKFEDIWTRTVDGVTTNLNTALDNKISVAEPSQLNPTDGATQGDGSVVHKYFADDSKDKWVYNSSDGYYYYKYNLPAADEKGIAGTTGKFLDSVRLKADIDMGSYKTQFWTYSGDDKEKPGTSLIDSTMEDLGWKKFGEPQDVNTAIATPSDGVKFTAAITKQEDGKLGYSDADYTLRITIETVQATDKAVETTFKDDIAAIRDQLSWELGSEDLPKETE